MDEKIEKAIKPLVEMYENIENELLEIIARHFLFSEEFENSDYWRIKKLDEMGLFNQEIVEYIARYTNKSKQVVQKALNEIGIETVNLDNLNRLFEDEVLKVNPNILVENNTIQNMINFAYNEISNRFIEMSSKIEQATRNAYLNVIEECYLKTSMGTHSYQEAIRQSIDKLGNIGITTLTYTTTDDEGNIVGIRKYDVAGTARREILTGARQLSNNINLEIANELNVKYLYLSEHLQCRPDHFDWQGTIIKRENLVDITDYGSITGLGGINCKHYAEPYFGDKRGDELKRFSEEETSKAYELSQKQRYIERGVRKWKRKSEMFKVNGDKEAYVKSNNKVKEWQLRVKDFTENNDLKRDYTREYISESKLKVQDYIDSIDITDETLKNATPNNGKVIDRKYFVDKNGTKYIVDGKNVEFNPSEEEIRMANWLKKTFGGNIYLNPKVNYPENVATSDYLWNNEFWDLKVIGKKATSETRAVDNVIKKAKKQTNNFILDITNNKLKRDIIENQVKKIYSTKGREWVEKIIIVDNYKLIKIYQRNKKRG